jgi:hypothetical protein
MIDTLEQFEQAEEAITKMKRFLLAVRRTHTPEAYVALSAPILRELQERGTFSSISADLRKWLLAIKDEQAPLVVVLKKSADATPLKSLGFAIYSVE